MKKIPDEWASIFVFGHGRGIEFENFVDFVADFVVENFVENFDDHDHVHVHDDDDYGDYGDDIHGDDDDGGGDVVDIVVAGVVDE